MNIPNFKENRFETAVTALNIGDMTPLQLGDSRLYNGSSYPATSLSQRFVRRLFTYLLELEKKGLVRRFEYDGGDQVKFKLYGTDETNHKHLENVFCKATGIRPSKKDFNFIQFVELHSPSPYCRFWSSDDANDPMYFSNAFHGYYSEASIKDIVTLELILKEYEVAVYEDEQARRDLF